ncbi:MAG: hypothetical protein RJA70_2929 [Pseudomonadota bacterium]|jgi:hypothetical protein
MATQDPAPRLPTTPGERRIVGVVGGVLASLLLAEVLRGFDPVRLSVLFVLLAWVPLLVLHELGHALAARSVGWRVSEIVIGFGREVTRFRVGETRVRIHAAPLEGYVVPSPKDTKHARYKSAWIYAAGPGIELVFVGLCWLLLGEKLVTTTESLWILAVQGSCVAALLGAGFNLLPYIAAGQMSDGLGILASLAAPDLSLQGHLAAPFVCEARRALHREQLEVAEQWVTTGLEKYPDDPQLLSLSAVCTAFRGRTDVAFELLESLGHPDDRAAGVRVELLLDAAWLVLLCEEKALLGDAQQACERALHLSPEHVRANLMHGRVLLQKGRPDEAYRSLMSGYKSAKDQDDEGQLVAYLVLACARGANRAYAARFVDELQRVPPGPALRALVQRENFPDIES